MIESDICATTPPRRNQNTARTSTGRQRSPVTRLLLVLIATVVVVLMPSSAVSAHTDLLQGSPGPAQQAGGTVDFVDLVFVDAVSNASITLEDPNGAFVDGVTVLTDGQIIRYEMPPLTTVGRYILRYSLTSADGDFTESGYFFVYDPDAVAPVRLAEADLPNNNATIITIAASVVFGLCVIGLVMIFLTKLERDRAKAAATDVG